MFSVATQNFGYQDGSSIYKISAGQDLVYVLVVQTSLWNVTCILDMQTKSFKIYRSNRTWMTPVTINNYCSQQLPKPESFYRYPLFTCTWIFYFAVFLIIWTSISAWYSPFTETRYEHTRRPCQCLKHCNR